ncbi:MAG TPA: VTT domain-containing protein [Candidatus Binatia bacterium]|nr:VTT domain-containing protein [Candidatus Binatia bacterium]
MEELLIRFGPIAVFFGAAVEGDLALVLGGVVAHLGLIDPVTAVIASSLGGLAGDAVWFAIGRRSAAAIRATDAYRRVGPTVERLAARFGDRQLLLARPIWGTRVMSMLFWGSQQMRVSRFLLLDALASTVWAVLLVSLGWAGSQSAEKILGQVHRVELWLLGAASIVVVVVVLLRRSR